MRCAVNLIELFFILTPSFLYSGHLMAVLGAVQELDFLQTKIDCTVACVPLFRPCATAVIR